MKYIFAVLSICSFYACSQSKKITTPQEAAAIEQIGSSPATIYNQGMTPKNADFSAMGSNPSNWNLQIVTNDSLRFESGDGLAVTARFAAMKHTTEGKTEIYAGKASGGNLKLEITEEQCTVPNIMQKIAFTRKVNVYFNDKLYSGCGRYDVNNNLSGKWMLESIGNKRIAVESYNKLPFFNFNLETRKFGGTDGCNSIGGEFEVQGDRIKFSDLFSTKMACMKDDVSQLIGGQISGKTVSFYFEKNKLVLYLGDDSKIYFTRG